ncbi:MAG: hypothetical protein JNJ83_14395 [Verrucomicrobiaceae bacterium]|nr:hypothetical protein [Verrucomicrobiaceae bacterium]
MLADSIPQVHSGRLDADIHLPSTAKLELIDFIARELPMWRDHPDRPTKTAETALTEHLCDHLNSASYYSEEWSHVQFRTETGDEAKAGRKIDLTVKPRAASLIIEGRRHSQFDSLFPIECKRLPTPAEGDRDKREYVITDPGTTGGIQRFKFGLHGSTHSFAAMIAFVQEKPLENWLGDVNGWITTLSEDDGSSWSASDLLELVNSDAVSKLQVLKSKHARSGGLVDCDLRHLWIRMN